MLDFRGLTDGLRAKLLSTKASPLERRQAAEMLAEATAAALVILDVAHRVELIDKIMTEKKGIS